MKLHIISLTMSLFKAKFENVGEQNMIKDGLFNTMGIIILQREQIEKY